MNRLFFFQLMCHNNANFFVPVFATWFLGGRASVVSPILSATNLSKQLSTVDIRHIFCAPCSVESVIEGVKILNALRSNEQIKVFLKSLNELKLFISKLNTLKIYFVNSCSPNNNNKIMIIRVICCKTSMDRNL